MIYSLYTQCPHSYCCLLVLHCCILSPARYLCAAEHWSTAGIACAARYGHSPLDRTYCTHFMSAHSEHRLKWCACDCHGSAAEEIEKRTRNSHEISIESKRLKENGGRTSANASASVCGIATQNFQEATMFFHPLLSHSHFPPHSFWPYACSFSAYTLSFHICRIYVCVCVVFFFASISRMLRRKYVLIDSFLFCDYVFSISLSPFLSLSLTISFSLAPHA